MNTGHLYHLTLTTGHGRRSPRSEVADDALASVREVVRAGSGTLAEIDIAILEQAAGGAAFALGHEGQSVVYCVLCWDDREHVARWAQAVEHFSRSKIPLAHAGFVEPPIPWLTVELLPAAAITPPDVMGMLGDAERCVAWALIEECQR